MRLGGVRSESTHTIYPKTPKFFFAIFPFRVYDDMDVVMTDDNKETLLTGNEECTINLINLLLTGRATKNLHNGNVIYDNDGKLLVG